MSYILKGIMSLFKFFSKTKLSAPTGLGAVYVLVGFAYDLFTHKGISFSLIHLFQRITAAELTINKGVHLALQHSPEYNISVFIDMLFAVLMLYILIKWLTKAQVGISGSQAQWSAVVFSILIVGVIEIATIAVIEKQWIFIPIRDGVWFLLMNLGPVFSNMHWFWQTI